MLPNRCSRPFLAVAVLVFIAIAECNADSAEIVLQAYADSSAHAVSWSPDGRTLATGYSDERVRLWDSKPRTSPAQMVLLRTFLGHGSEVTSVAWSPDGKRLASASSDKTVKLWDAESGKLLGSLGPRRSGLERGMESGRKTASVGQL
jgi:WD40 repeat protein